MNNTVKISTYLLKLYYYTQHTFPGLATWIWNTNKNVYIVAVHRWREYRITIHNITIETRTQHDMYENVLCYVT
jgi:hypothetical protein